MNRKPVIFDARSAGSKRSSGWENYTRAVRDAVLQIDFADIFDAAPRTALERVVSDQFSVPWNTRGHSVVHFPSYPPPLAISSKRCITTIHDMTWWKYPETSSRLGALYYKPLMERRFDSRIIVTVSEAVATELRSVVSAPVRVIPNVVRIDQVPAEPFPFSGRPYMLAVGSVEPRKNLERLAKAFVASGVGKEFDLLVVGRQAWGTLPQGVRATGSVTDGQLRSLYENAHALFAASLYEGFGLPVAEAIALGTPVYCSDIASFSEASGGASQGRFDPLSIDSIASQFVAATAETQRPPRANPFSSQRCHDAVLSVYQEALSQA